MRGVTLVTSLLAGIRPSVSIHRGEFMEEDQRKKEILLDLFLDLGIVGKMKMLVDQASQISAEKHKMPEMVRAISNRLSDKVLINIFVYAYSKHYSLEEIQQLHEFYNSGLGKKMTSTDPLVQRDMVAGLMVELRNIAIQIQQEEPDATEGSSEVGHEESPERSGTETGAESGD
jgi:hypothetical protein